MGVTGQDVVQLDIHGHSIRIRYKDIKEKERIEKISQWVNCKILELKKGNEKISTLSLLVWACLNITQEYLEMTAKTDRIFTELSDSLDVIITEVDGIIS